MARKIRFTPDGGALYEVTCRTVHSRFLLRPGPLLNEIIVGALGRAQRLYPLEICAFVFASNHFHLPARAEDSERLARFTFNLKLAREVAGSAAAVLSADPWADPIVAEVRATRERIVEAVGGDLHALGEQLRTREAAAGRIPMRSRARSPRSESGEDFGARQFAETEVLNLSPSRGTSDPSGGTNEFAPKSLIPRAGSLVLPAGPTNFGQNR